MSEYMSGRMSEHMPDTMYNRMPNTKPDRPSKMSDRMSECILCQIKC